MICSLLYVPASVQVGYIFHRRRAFATGILFTEQTLSTIFLQASPPVVLVLGLSSLLLSFAT